MTRLSSRHTLAAALGSAAAAGSVLAVYAADIEPHWPEVVRLELPLARLPERLDGLSIAQISDLHAGYAAGPDRIRSYVDTVNALNPDVVAITGDMFHSGAVSAWMCAAELSELRPPLGVYVVMGNHERQVAPEVGEIPFRRVGLTVLVNAAHPIEVDGDRLWIVGVDDVLMRRSDLRQTLRGVPETACKILLAHEPDLADRAAQFPIDLQLSGHTHGGQIRVPGVGALLLPVMGRKYPMGLYRVDGMWVYTNRGLGVNRPAVRFNCRPEITIFTLRAADRVAAPVAGVAAWHGGGRTGRWPRPASSWRDNEST
jgi:predicted MPP superfamily phosphohydrolase